eukprot:scaffold26907_cov72-Phaeocystis_antarctica.AAC.3
MGLLNTTDRSVIRQLSFLGRVRLAPPGWPCTPERERCSDQIEPHSPRRGPRRLDRPVSRTQSEGKHAAGA